MSISKIVVPTDGSSFSHRAAKLAVEIAKATHSSVIALHVIEVKPPKLLEGSNIEKIKVRQAEICFTDFKESAADAGIEHETKMLVSRDVTKTILEEIEIQNPDIVVMGSHGLTGIKRLLLGSIAESVLEKSTAPLLIVK